MTNKCKCSLAISLNGDGCRYCQPHEYINRLTSAFRDLENENKMLREALESIVEFLNTESNSTEEMVAHAWTTTRKALK